MHGIERFLQDFYNDFTLLRGSYRFAYRLGGIRRFAWEFLSLCTIAYGSSKTLRTLAASCFLSLALELYYNKKQA